ncbi:hypothetical protein BBBOND_0206810 [Babesia bigemina]|uniref:Uncharacterized protein n=1 Tax=Babesia bigemina TaxID=5866 RepID=A0A061D4M2_BABBI|nr:hypothetical protein BBBOND_0206810 [Babesia bigemina]CDR95523.1 hypothetical protein BBBOND_0206810 [Babesia bigemina]|eukprot:XP_012767709.1 hypothetical protein BBBOND_0206810 [Babesia bigemina]
MVYNSLTDVPRNLKEGIDWLIALRGTDPDNNLGAMGALIYDFLLDKPVGKTEVPALEKVKLVSKEFVAQPEIRNLRFAKKLLKRYEVPMDRELDSFARSAGFYIDSDYKNVVKTRGDTHEDIATDLATVVDGCEAFLNHIKIPEQYESAYSSKATWDASCTKDPEACALVLVYNLEKPDDKVREHLADVIKAVGYGEPGCRSSMSGPDVLKALESVNLHVLISIRELAAFWAFY